VSSREGWHLIFMEDMVCSFFGHRDTAVTDKLYDDTFSAFKRAIELGCRVFYFGGYGTFDELCYEIVTKIKSDNLCLKIKKIFCVTQERYLRKKSRYFKRADYDEVIFLEPSFNGWYKSIYFRNCAMIDKSDIVIFYAQPRADSGAYKAYKYAKSKADKLVINLFDI